MNIWIGISRTPEWIFAKIYTQILQKKVCPKTIRSNALKEDGRESDQLWEWENNQNIEFEIIDMKILTGEYWKLEA